MSRHSQELPNRARRNNRGLVAMGLAGALGALLALPVAGAATGAVDLSQVISADSGPLIELHPASDLAPTSTHIVDAAHQTVQQTVKAERAAAAAAAREAKLAEKRAEQAAQRESQALISLAKAQIGDSYSMGAAGPDVFDCSGFTMWVYQQTKGISLPHNTHAQYAAMSQTWAPGEQEPQPGDLVFFFNGADHVGLYIGDGMMVHAANPGAGVELRSVNDSWYSSAISGYGRP